MYNAIENIDPSQQYYTLKMIDFESHLPELHLDQFVEDCQWLLGSYFVPKRQNF